MLMTKDLFYSAFDTAAGWIALAGSPTGLCRVVLPVRSRDEAVSRLGSDISRAKEHRVCFRDAVDQLTRYFDNQEVNFNIALDFDGATGFQQKVWQAARLIPYGETRSYGWIARQIDKPQASRAVGQALGKNPLPVIVPCHRVLSSSGGLGGFTGGLDMKRFLLGIEGKAHID
jgi:methylated-DNA-[protein]-cysteine S-methyltransferase